MPTAVHLEIERTYEVPGAGPVPSLLGLPGVATVAPPVVHTLRATYFDTPVLSLARRGVTLRRRTGGDDEGWHVKVPAATDARTETQRPLGRAVHTVPVAVRRMVRVHVRAHPLAPVAVVDNHRTVHRLLAPDGAVLAEVCDDEVTGRALGEQPGMARWREWEVELVGGDAALLAAVHTRLLDAGARTSATSSKLGRTLGFRLPPSAPTPAPPTRGSPAGVVVLAAVRVQVEALHRLDPLVRTDSTDAVHQVRVATRTLRSLLATYRPVLQRAVTEPLRAELRWLAGELGGARDGEVVRQRCAELLAAQPGGLALGPVARRVRTHFDAAHRAARQQVRCALDSARYFALLDALDGLLLDPPLTALAAEPARVVLPRCVHHAWRRLRRAVRTADAATSDEREPARHEVRKRAKRLRYACEAAEPACGTPAARTARAAQRVQSVLGEQQDAVTARLRLRDVAAEAHTAGEITFTYGRLDAVLERAGADVEQPWARAWHRLQRPSRRRWLSR